MSCCCRAVGTPRSLAEPPEGSQEDTQGSSRLWNGRTSRGMVPRSTAP